MITGGQASGRAGFAADGESYIACIYPYTEGAKVYLIGVYSKPSNDGIDGWLADKIRKAVRGEDDQAYAKMFKDMLAKIKSGVNNNIAFEQIEWPDGSVEHPDIVSVATKKNMTTGNIEAASAIQTPSKWTPIEGRKELTALGISYYNSTQFIDAIKRKDRLVVELFIAGDGLDVAKMQGADDPAIVAKATGDDLLTSLIESYVAKHKS